MTDGEMLMGQNWVEQYKDNLFRRPFRRNIGRDVCDVATDDYVDAFMWDVTPQGYDVWCNRHHGRTDTIRPV